MPEQPEETQPLANRTTKPSAANLPVSARKPVRSMGAYRKLNDRQRQFVRNIMKGQYVTRAYQNAGYNSEKPARDALSLKNSPNVRAAMGELRALAGLEAGAMAETLRDLVYGTGLTVEHLEPWLRGEKTLRELADTGMDLSWVETVSIGEKGGRRIVMASRLTAMRLLAELGGLIVHRASITTDAPPVQVNIQIVPLTADTPRAIEATVVRELPGPEEQ